MISTLEQVIPLVRPEDLDGKLDAPVPVPVVQTFATADATHAAQTAVAVANTAATNVAPFGYSTAAQADAIRTNLNALRNDHLDLAAFVNTIADALQAAGILV